MKIKKLLLLFFVLFITLCAQSQSKSKPVVIIEGHFFKEIPVSKAYISGLYLLKTDDGVSALGVELSKPLPEGALKYSIPKEQITKGDELLEKFTEARKRKVDAVVASSTKRNLNVGDKFPDFSATDMDGKTWTNADVDGKVMVLNLWFTGCAPCRSEMPELSRWKDEMPDVMFFSSTYESAERAKPVIEKYKFNWIPIVNDDKFIEFVGGNGYPLTVVIDKNGIVSMVEFGTSEMQRVELKKKILSLR